jgi:ADP-heptose:LPS heptosyltransferase
VSGQANFDELMKYIFTYSQIVIGNSSAMTHVPRVASKQGTPTINKPR